MMPHIEHVVFGTLVALNLALGLYFSLRRKARSADTAAEVFLGGRALRAIPLAASVVASLFSSMGLVGMAGHFYAYGFHLMWNGLTTLFMAPIAAHLFLPVFYDLRITSVFEVSMSITYVFFLQVPYWELDGRKCGGHRKSAAGLRERLKSTPRRPPRK
ncbi:hypothetical protein HPB48_022187 [Haemaphysalis longicornis]|uniref:Sodium-dependent multivitamin transporter n=1 Tax=Haemaphysalis longicornis TaxID=44386 RepID=A0A9J6H3B0_HAELO|nr:hypothetical protein HPB48_022187 [Haemaphysalis longicornis]